jgi:ABC-type amino acid transport/signal transduction systems, periplasmic component/domain
VKPEFTDVSGDARVSMLVSNQLDLVVANTSATLARAKAVSFSIPYNRAGLRIIVQADAGITTLEGLAGKKVVVGRGTTGETFLKRAVPTAELVYTDNFLARRRAAAQAEARRRRHRGLVDARLPRHQGPVAHHPARPLLQRPDRHCHRPGATRSSSAGSTCSSLTTSSSGAYEANYKKWWGEKANPPTLTPLW